VTGLSPKDARAINVRTVDYVVDGLAMRGHLAIPAGAGPHPGVLVFPEGYGLSDQAILRAERIASEMGYVALACDLHGEARELSGLEEVLQKLEPLQKSSDCVRGRVVPAYEALLAQAEVDPAKIGAIGFCFGGTMALELALTGRDIGAVVGFHSGLALTAPQDAPNIKAAILLLLGADDPSIDAKQRLHFEQTMREAEVRWEMHVYGGVRHSFTNPKAHERGLPDWLRYDPVADRRSWNAMRAFLDELWAAPDVGTSAAIAMP